MKVQAEKFVAVLKTVGAVAAEPAITSSQFVRLIAKGDSLRLTLAGVMFGDGTVKADVATKEEWTFYADRRALSAFAGSASGILELIVKGTTLTITGPHQTMKLSAPTEAVAGYGVWPVTEKVDLVLNSDDTAALGQYCSTGAGGEQFAAVQFISKFGALASDSIVLSAIRNDKCPQAVVPCSLTPHLARSGGSSILVGKSGVGVVLPDGRLYQTLHSSLKSCPVDKLMDVVKTGLSQPIVFSCPASELGGAVGNLNAFPYVGASLIGTVSIKEKQLHIQVDFPSGTTQRYVVAQFAPKASLSTQWPLNRIYPWIKYISGKDDSAVIACRRMDAATVFEMVLSAKEQYVLVFSDL